MKWEYLHPADRPVVDGLEKHEVVYAKDQPQYIPLRCLRARTPFVEVLSRWTLTPEQRKMIAEGADIFLELSTFGMPLQPIRLQVSADPEPWFFEQRYKLQLNCGCFGTCNGHTGAPAVNEIACPRCGKYTVLPNAHCPGCGWVWATSEKESRPKDDRDDLPPQPDRHHA